MMKIASIDKHPVLRVGLSVFLENHFKDITVLEAESIRSFGKMYKNDSPDIAIIGLEEESEVDMVALKRMMRSNPNTSFIVYAGRPQYKIAVSCLCNGVKGYVLKNSHINELMGCIETVMDGRRYLSQELTNIFVDEYLELFDTQGNYRAAPKPNVLGKFLNAAHGNLQ